VPSTNASVESNADESMERVLSNIEMLDGTPLQMLDFDADNLMTDKVVMSVDKVKKWKWYVRPAFVPNFNRVVNNLQLGVGLSKDMSTRWNVGAGLGIKILEFNLVRLESSSVLADGAHGFGGQVPDPAFSDRDNVFSSYLFDDNFESSNNLNVESFRSTGKIWQPYGYVSTFVNYKLISRWDLRGGVDFNVTGNSTIFKNHIEFHISPTYQLSSRNLVEIKWEYLLPSNFKLLSSFLRER